jgi:hypothetical protein
MNKGSGNLLVMLALCVLAISLLMAARFGFLTDRGGNLVVAVSGLALAMFYRRIAAWSQSVGERHVFLSHWQQVSPVWFLVVGVAVAIGGVWSAFA